MFISILLLSTALTVNAHSQGGQGEHESHGARSPHEKFHDHHYKDGQHDSHADHEAVLGSKQTAKDFDSLSPEESKQRLGKLAEKMDANHDGFVDETELYKWIYDHMMMLDAEEAGERFNDIDDNHDGFVSWTEYRKDAFGEDELDVDDQRLMSDDETYFKAADKDGDGKLSREEFVAFQSPEQHQHMHNAVVENTLRAKDTDKDEHISLNEFLGEYADKKDSEWYTSEKARFTEEFDKNRDGRLDRTEMRLWLTPDLADAARQETVHLMSEADTDRDGQLAYAEIKEAHSIFVGSEATNYGEHLVKHVEL